MTTIKDELLSAFVDEEVTELEVRRLCKELPGDVQALARWHRYHLMRDALRGNLPAKLDVGFAARVMAKLEDEGVQMESEARPWSERLLRPVAGFGLAASVAVAAVLGFQSFTGPSATAPEGALVSLQATPQTTGAANVASADRFRRDASIRNPEMVARLNSYLVNHSEFAPSRGVMPYARVVAGYGTVQP